MLTISGVVKLIDLGICADLTVDGPRTEMVGSPLWVPPEMIRLESHDCKADVWSFAICLLELVNGHPPLSKTPFKAMVCAASYGVPDPFENPEKWTEKFQDFIHSCLIVEQAKRFSSTDLEAHPFITQTQHVTKDQMKDMLTSAYKQTMEMFNL